MRLRRMLRYASQISTIGIRRLGRFTEHLGSDWHLYQLVFGSSHVFWAGLSISKFTQVNESDVESIWQMLDHKYAGNSSRKNHRDCFEYVDQCRGGDAVFSWFGLGLPRAAQTSNRGLV